jgi:hypothetical protein
VSFLEGPSVDRAAVPSQLEEAWFVKLLGGALVHALHPRQDHGVVEQPTETLLIGDIRLDVFGERIVVGEHPAE